MSTKHTLTAPKNEAQDDESDGTIVAWTRREFQAELRKAGWKRMKGSTGTYVSPLDPTVHYHLDNYRRSFGGVSWRYFAGRRELPEQTKPPF